MTETQTETKKKGMLQSSTTPSRCRKHFSIRGKKPISGNNIRLQHSFIN
jgi:hypothetical protein